MTEVSSEITGRPPLWRAALFGLCPRCDAPTLFDGPIQFAAKCGGCGQDYSANNVGDGPAAFLTMIISAVVIALAMTLEFAVYPPFWVHVILWVPFTVAAVIGGLRMAKGLLFHAEVRRSAGEGVLAEDQSDD
ncbi:MAG: DUF983 domain-containing protein [Sphingopyxis sp.]|nr:DUF983 domain-containing protein [Sphingopyxis sp.]